MLEELGLWERMLGWLKSAVTLRATVANHEKRLVELQKQMEELIDRAPPKPDDPRLVHGIYWGIPKGGDRRVAYCSVCAQDGKWIPVQIWDEAGKRKHLCFVCQSCEARLTVEQEAEAQKL